MKNPRNTKTMHSARTDDRGHAGITPAPARVHTLEPISPSLLRTCMVWMRGSAAAHAASLVRSTRRGAHWAYLHCAAALPTLMMSV